MVVHKHQDYGSTERSGVQSSHPISLPLSVIGYHGCRNSFALCQESGAMKNVISTYKPGVSQNTL